MQNDALPIQERQGRVGTPRRNALRQGAMALFAALVLGAMAGVWVSNQKLADANDNWARYEQAEQEYKSGRDASAVAEIRKALYGRLVLKSGEAEFSQFATLRDLARKDAAYALSLAEKGKEQDAMAVNDLTLTIGDQLLQSRTLLPALVAAAMDQLAMSNRPKILSAVGDAAGAHAEEASFDKMKTEFLTIAKPAAESFAQGGRAYKGARLSEADAVQMIAHAWGRNLSR